MPQQRPRAARRLAQVLVQVSDLALNDPSLYNNADQMLVETRNLVKSVRENPKRYLTIKFKLF